MISHEQSQFLGYSVPGEDPSYTVVRLAVTNVNPTHNAPSAGCVKEQKRKKKEKKKKEKEKNSLQREECEVVLIAIRAIGNAGPVCLDEADDPARRASIVLWVSRMQVREVFFFFQM